MKIETFFENFDYKFDNSDLLNAFEELKQTLLEENNTWKLIDKLSKFICYALIIAKNHKMKFGNSPDSDLNSWVLNIEQYQKKFKISDKYFVETTEKNLESFIKKTDKHLLFEIITQTFLFIDFKHYSIINIITLFLDKIPTQKTEIKNSKKEEKEEVIVEEKIEEKIDVIKDVIK